MCNYTSTYELIHDGKIEYFDTVDEAIDYIFENRVTGKLIGFVCYYIYMEGHLIHMCDYASEEALIESKLAEFLSFDYAVIIKKHSSEYTAHLHNLDKTDVSFTYEGGEIQIHQNKEDSQ